MPLTH